jgi:hypothetical protein
MERFMKFFNTHVKSLSIFAIILSIGILSLYAFDPFNAIKEVSDSVIKTGGEQISELTKIATPATEIVGKAADEIGKIAAPVTNLALQISNEAMGELAKLGLPTDPRKLIEFLFSQMSDLQIKELANNIMKIVIAQMSDFSKMQSIILQPVHAVTELIPLIPSTDMISDFVLDFTIAKYQLQTFAQIKAFHETTNYRYVSEKEQELIKSREEFESAKGLVGQNLDLNQAREISRQISDLIKKFISPLQQLLRKLEDLGSPVLKPLEALIREFRPTPFACLVNGGFLYNRTIFICHIKKIEGLFEDNQFIFNRNLDDVHLDKSRYASLVDWEKEPIASTFMKVLRTTLSPANTLLERFDEMFVDPIADLPWGLKSICTMTVTLAKLGTKIAGFVIKEIISQMSSAGTGGTAGTAGGTAGSAAPAAGTAAGGGSSGGSSYATAQVITKVLSQIINESFVVDMIAETFYWSWIRYIEKRFDRMKELITQARADGVAFDSKRYKEEFKKIIEFKEDYITGKQSQPAALTQQPPATSGDSEPTSTDLFSDGMQEINELLGDLNS